jgi:5,10-methylenetetrahydromethanopterin reductase
MAKQRVGYALGYGKFTNVREMADVMKQAEERGFEMAFFSETIELMRDSVSSLTAIGLATKKLQMGTTQIVRLRGPVVMAQLLATIDELTDGRLTLAPGACTKSHARVHALPTEVGATPSEVLREYIEAMRLLLSGDKVSYQGKFVKFDNVGLGWKPVRTKIPFYVPATATVGLKLAGEIEDDHKKALDAVRWEVATKLDPVQISFIAGPKMRVGEPYIHKQDIPLFEKAHAAGGMEGLIKAIPDSYVEGMTASGTPDEVKKRVQQYRDAGVQIPLLRPAAAHQTQRLLDLFAQ